MPDSKREVNIQKYSPLTKITWMIKDMYIQDRKTQICKSNRESRKHPIPSENVISTSPYLLHEN